MKSFLFVMLALGSAQADNSIILPMRLVKNENRQFYTRAQVCEHARSVSPEKKAAMVIVKTHICDGYTKVCLKTTALVSDAANLFVHDNFTVYQTRFMSLDHILPHSGEAAIRETWDKPGSDPEFVIIDVRTCQVIFRKYAKEAYNRGMFAETIQREERDGRWYGALTLDFDANYRALRELLLTNLEVSALLDNRYRVFDEAQIADELSEIHRMRSTYPQPTIDDIHNRLLEQDHEFGVDAGMSPHSH